MNDQELKELFEKLYPITDQLGVKHYGTEIHQALEDVLTAVRKQYRLNNPDKLMVEIIKELKEKYDTFKTY